MTARVSDYWTLIGDRPSIIGHVLSSKCSLHPSHHFWCRHRTFLSSHADGCSHQNLSPTPKICPHMLLYLLAFCSTCWGAERHCSFLRNTQVGTTRRFSCSTTAHASASPNVWRQLIGTDPQTKFSKNSTKQKKREVSLCSCSTVMLSTGSSVWTS